MKPINEMSLLELADALETATYAYQDELEALSKRLRELHNLTRWIPVEERLPTEEDVDKNGEVLAYSPDPTITVSASSIPMSHHFTHWRRIDTPGAKS